MISREDALSDVLEALRIKGSVLLHEAYLAPWAVSVPAADALAPLLGAGERNWPVAFHYVERGQCDIALQSGEIATLDAGDLAICFSGQAHRIEAGNPLMTVPVTELMGGGHNPFRPSAQEPRGTSLVCGAFLLDDLRLTPLWSSCTEASPTCWATPHSATTNGACVAPCGAAQPTRCAEPRKLR